MQEHSLAPDKKRKFKYFPGLLILIIAVLLWSMIFLIKEQFFESPCEISGNLKGFNLIYINIDALRADHLGCYGYARKTSPFIDSVAQKNLVFTRALSNSSYTRESVAALFSGQLPSRSGSTGWLAVPRKKGVSMGDLFRSSGYKTGLFSCSPQLKSKRFRRGFDCSEILAQTWGMSRGGMMLTDRTLQFIDGLGNEKFMVYMHYLDPHGPYDPPAEYYHRFSKKTCKKPVSLYKELRPRCHEFIARGFGPGSSRFEDLVVRYDAEIAFVDHSIHRLFKGLRKRKLLHKTVVIISADHGEEFLEHGFVEHAWTLFQEVLHVPLIFRIPGIKKGRKITDRVALVDILPSLVDMFKLNDGDRDFDGTSLFVSRKNSICYRPRTIPIIAETLIQHRSMLRAVIHGEWKYVAARRWLPPQKRPGVLPGARELELNKKRHRSIWGPVVHEALYNLRRDPGETENVMVQSVLKKMRKILALFQNECLKKKTGRISPSAPKKNLSSEEKKKLKTLGYF